MEGAEEDPGDFSKEETSEAAEQPPKGEQVSREPKQREKAQAAPAQGACIFCRIASGASKAYKLYEDGDVIGILDAFPVTEGHVLVIPKRHARTFFEVDEATLAKLFSVSRALAAVLKKALSADSFNISTAPASIDHFHIHVIPRYDYDLMGPLADLDNKREISQEKMKEIHGKIMAVLSKKP